MNRITIGAMSVLFFATCACPALAEETNAEARDAELARQTLALYDSLEAQDPFSPRNSKLRLNDSAFKNAEPKTFRLEGKAQSREERAMPLSEESWDRNRVMENRSMRVVEMKQRAADRVADMISPGFGRKEFNIGGHARGRFDYIYAGKCRVKGLGMCVHITFQ